MSIKDFDFKPGTLVQVRNTRIEKSLDRKMHPRYMGPMIVIRRTKGGAYILAEMDGSVLREKVAAFRVLPHKARYEPIALPDNIHDLIDLDPLQLRQMVEEEEVDESYSPGRDLVFDAIPNLRMPVYDQDGELVEQANPDKTSTNEEPVQEDQSDAEESSRRQTRASIKNRNQSSI